MLVEKIVVGALGTNCYIIAPGANCEAAVVDPGADAFKIQEKLKQLNLKIKFIINTHGHCDHIGADSELAGGVKVPIYIHFEDAGMLNDGSANLSLYCGERIESVDAVTEVADGQILQLGNLDLQIIHTPGHTKGSISILLSDGENRLFTGDLLFKGSVGRTDFPGSSFQALLNSLKKLTDLPDDTRVYPGHGPETFLGEEKQNNMFFKEID